MEKFVEHKVYTVFSTTFLRYMFRSDKHFGELRSRWLQKCEEVGK